MSRLLVDRERVDGVAVGRGDVLLTVHGVGDRVAERSAAGLESPEQLAGLVVEGEDIAFVGTAKHQAAGGRDHAGPGRAEQWELPHQRASQRVERAHGAVLLVLGHASEAAADEERAFLERRLATVEYRS